MKIEAELKRCNIKVVITEVLAQQQWLKDNNAQVRDTDARDAACRRRQVLADGKTGKHGAAADSHARPTSLDFTGFIIARGVLVGK